MKKLFTISVLMSNLLLGSEVSIESIGLNIGQSNSDYSQNDSTGNITLGNTPNKNFNSYEVFGEFKNKIYGMTPYISMSHSFNTDIEHQYILTGLNKYYNHNKLDLYAGVLMGYGQMEWKYNPLNNSKDNNEDANSLIAGLQMGINYPINNKFSLGINGKYLVHNYETKLNPSTGINSTIEHKYTSSLGVGFIYKF